MEKGEAFAHNHLGRNHCRIQWHPEVMTADGDTSDSHTMIWSTTGGFKTTGVLYPNLEFTCAYGLSFLCTDTKGDGFRDYAGIAQMYYGYIPYVIDLRNPTRNHGFNLLHLVNKYMDLYTDTGKLEYKARENTYECYKYIIRIIQKFRPELSSLLLDGVDEIYIQKLINEAATSYSKSTIKKIATIFKASYNSAMRNKKCLGNPATALKIPEASEKEILPLTIEEERIVIEAAKKDILGVLSVYIFLLPGSGPENSEI